MSGGVVDSDTSVLSSQLGFYTVQPAGSCGVLERPSSSGGWRVRLCEILSLEHLEDLVSIWLAFCKTANQKHFLC